MGALFTAFKPELEHPAGVYRLYGVDRAGRAFKAEAKSYGDFASDLTGREVSEDEIAQLVFHVEGIEPDDVVQAVACQDVPRVDADGHRVVEHWCGERWSTEELPEPDGALGLVAGVVAVALLAFRRGRRAWYARGRG